MPKLRFFRQKPVPETDEALLGRYQAVGDLQDLALLYGRYVELVYGVCLRYLTDETRAADAVMDVFETLAGKVREHEIREFRPWLYVLVRNHCLQQLRSDNKNITVTQAPEIMQSPENWHPWEEKEEETARQTVEKQLSECLDRLNEGQAQCVRLFYYEEKSYQEIAESCAMPLGQVRSNIQNGRRNLRNCLEDKRNENY